MVGKNDMEILRENLTWLGLTETQVELYLAVLEQGTTVVSDLAETTGISQPAIYDNCEALADRRLVSVDRVSRPARIRAEPWELFNDQVEARMDSIRSIVGMHRDPGGHDYGPIEYFDSARVARNYVAELVAGADREVRLVYPAARIDDVAEELRSAVEKGVFVLLVLSGVDDDDPDLEEVDSRLGSVIRTVPKARLLGGVDQAYCLDGSPDVLWEHRDSMGMHIATDLHRYWRVSSRFNDIWERASDVASAPPESMPQEYTWFHRAVLDATHHLRADRAIRAVAEVSPQEDPNSTMTLEGEVVTTYQNLLRPTTNRFPSENSLSIDVGDEVVLVGGQKATEEPYASRGVTRLEAL